jgi:hypothetical protein
MQTAWFSPLAAMFQMPFTVSIFCGAASALVFADPTAG